MKVDAIGEAESSVVDAFSRSFVLDDRRGEVASAKGEKRTGSKRWLSKGTRRFCARRLARKSSLSLTPLASWIQ